MADSVALSGDIRKLRKKLRQIENLEQLERELTYQEYTKIDSKDDIREELQSLVLEREKLQREERKMAAAAKVKSTEDNTTQVTTCSEDMGGVQRSDGEQNEREQATENHVEPDSSGGERRQKVNVDEQTQATSSEVGKEVSAKADASKVVAAVVASTAASSKSSASVSAPSVARVVSSSKSPSSQPATSTAAVWQQDLWKNVQFSVKVLEGHNDLICAVDCWESLVISGSRDTTLKLWDADTGREIRSMGGHTGSVTSVKLLPNLDLTSDEIPSISNLRQYMAITGSKDCSIRLWSLGDGQIRRSIYTYSAVECLDYHNGLTVSGSEGGKIELWNMDTGDNVRSIKAHDDAVTAIKFQDGRVVSGSTTGVVKIWDVRDRTCHPVISSDKTDSENVSIKKRHIRCLATSGNCVYWGDNGVNIKVLDLTSGKVRKIRNHVDDFGSTNALIATSSCLVSAGYDIDRGNGYLNVRSLPNEEYLATIDDNSTGCITCLARAQVNREGVTLHRLCTGGSQLKLWNQLPAGRVKKRTRTEAEDSFITAKHIRRYNVADVSDTDSSEDENEHDNYGGDDGDDGDDDDNSGAASPSWCTIC